MGNHPKQNRVSTATSGPVDNNRSRSIIREIVRDSQAAGAGWSDVKTGRPTVAGAVPKGHERRFDPAPINEAEFLRLCPAKGRCRFTGLSRSGLVAAAKAAGAFISVRLPGRVRGAVLIDREKLTAFLKNKASDGKEAGHE